MRSKTLALIFLFLFGGFSLTGCVSGLIPSSWTGVATDQKRVFIAAGSQVYAIQLSDGRELWNFPEKASASKTFFAAPALTPDGQLIVGGYDKILYSLDPGSGTINWQFEEARDRWIASAYAANDMIYAPSADYSLYALNMQGELQWKFEAGQAIWAAPVADDRHVYIGSLDHKVYALDARTGTPAWEQPSELDGAILSAPILGAENVLYISTYAGSVYALDSDNGEVIWQSTGDSPFWASPILVEDAILIGDYSGMVHSISIENGERTSLPAVKGSIFGNAVMFQDNVVFCTDMGYVYSVDLAVIQPGLEAIEPLYSFAGEFFSSPVIAGSNILVAPQGDANLLIALKSDGSQKWTFSIEK